MPTPVPPAAGAAVDQALPPAARVPIVEPEALGLLREDLAGYTVDALRELLGPTVQAALGRDQLLPTARWTSSLLDRPPSDLAPSDRPPSHLAPDALAYADVAAPSAAAARGAALVRLFLLSRTLPRRHAEAALPSLGVDGAQRLGLVAAAGHGRDDEVRPLVDLQPYAAVDVGGTAHWWIVSDLPARPSTGPLPVDHVLGVGGASLMLAGCTIRRPVARALDLGTGCGVQALHAARHAGEVTATDISARALHFARFTWALNAGPGTAGPSTAGTLTAGPGAAGPSTARPSTARPDTAGAGLRLRHGSLLDPVAGERFDLVVSNPPFVITPRAAGVPRYEYRDGGGVGDELVGRLITRLGAALAPGGVAQLLGNWEHHRGEPWQQRVGSWLEASGLDGWVVQREVQDPAEYAETWIRDGGQAEGPEFDALYAAWLDDFEARQVEAVGFGLVTLRRPADGGPGAFRRVEEVRNPVAGPLGDHLEACLAAVDWLASSAPSDDALAAARLRVAPDVTEERHHRPGAEHPQIVLLRQGAGFGRAVQASTGLAGLVGACDGELSVGQLVGALAGLLDLPVAELSGELLPAVRRLVADGFLVPSDARP